MITIQIAKQTHAQTTQHKSQKRLVVGLKLNRRLVKELKPQLKYNVLLA